MLDAKVKSLYFLLALYLVFSSCNSLEKRNRNKKFFSLFSLVQFPNSQCSSAGANNGGEIGTCYSTEECRSKNGMVIGNCASGFGVCCSFVLRTSGSVATENLTFITNPEFPQAAALPAALPATTFTVNVRPQSADICQIRVDFARFNLRTTPNAAVGAGRATCVDSLTITTGSGTEPPILCGLLDGQHIYLETGRLSLPIPFLFTTAIAAPVGGSGPGPAIWRLRLTQMECGNPRASPGGCLQYYTGTTGNVKSFNFGPATTGYLYPMIYSVCMRREVGFCSIAYSEAFLATMGGGTSGFFLQDTGAAFLTLNRIVKLGAASSLLIIPGSKLYAYSGMVLSEDVDATASVTLGGVAAGNNFLASGSPGVVVAKGPTFGFTVIHNNVFMRGGVIDNGFFNVNFRQLPCST